MTPTARPPQNTVQVMAVEGIGEVGPDTDLAAVITGAIGLQDGDVVVVASKVVAKAEGRTVTPRHGETTPDARRRLAMAEEVLVDTSHVVVVRTRHGFVCANAGIDASNMPDGKLLLLPVDPDASAADLRTGISARVGVSVGVVISDTFGRAWRDGQTDVALGVAGLPALRDERGSVDREGRRLDVTLVALADQIAGAADLVRRKASGIPVVVIRGLDLSGPAGTGSDLVRGIEGDLFPHGRGWVARRLAAGDDLEAGSVRRGPPADWEWDLVLAAVGGRRDGTTLEVDTGLAAGRAECALLDLGYRVVVSGAGPWLVSVLPGT